MLPRGIESISHRAKLSLSRKEKKRKQGSASQQSKSLGSVSTTVVFWVAFSPSKNKILGFTEELKFRKGSVGPRTALFHVKDNASQ